MWFFNTSVQYRKEIDSQNSRIFLETFPIYICKEIINLLINEMAQLVKVTACKAL